MGQGFSAELVGKAGLHVMASGAKDYANIPASLFIFCARAIISIVHRRVRPIDPEEECWSAEGNKCFSCGASLFGCVGGA